MARTTATVSFQALELKGSLLPASLLEEISKLARPKELLLEPKDYGLCKGEGLRERIDAAWVLTKELWEEYTDLSDRAGKSIAGQHFGTRLLKEVFGWSGTQPCNGWQQGESHYPINARAFDGAVPVILRGLDPDDLDRGSAQFGQEGRKRSPHSCLQECLNADDDANWGVLLSGDRLRLLHDNPSLVKPAYMAADLELLIEGGLHAEFAVLWLLLHSSRFRHPQTGSCVLDDWKQQAEASGERVLGALRGGVQSALESIGCGFLNHPSNGELRESLQNGQLSRQQFHEQLLRLVYRFLFLFTTEDRNLLFPREVDKTDARRRIYQEGYSVSRLRELAIKRSAYEGDYGDLWELQRLVFQQLSIGNSPLGLPGLGGLFSLEQCPDLQDAELWNGPLLRAIKAIGWFDADGSFTRVRYRDLNTEELGSVYEGLLELHPQLEQQGSQWQLSYGGGAGSDRKTTGSYYTPDALVQELIKSALIPVIDDRLSKAHGQAEQEQALLKIKVIDPACGSGHFLLAAARRLAVALAQVRAGDDQPSEDNRQHALRDVVAHCIFAVDKNPMAVELCKVALWIEAIDPGKPLSFLDAHIQCGDSLVGVFDPKVLEEGIPDGAYKPLTGDNKTVCTSLKKENAGARKTISRRGSNRGIQGSLALSGTQPRSQGQQELQAIEAMPESSLAETAAKQAAYAQWLSDRGQDPETLAADLYTAAFFLTKTSDSRATVPTTEHLLKLLAGQPVDEAMEEAVVEAAQNFRFFHWHLRFGEVMEQGGFDCVLGNPPWEQLEAKSETEKIILGRQQLFFKESNRYPTTSSARKNLYALFSEFIFFSLATKDSSGLLVPTSIVQDSPISGITHDLISKEKLSSLLDFENKRKSFAGKWFKDVHANYRFCLITTIKPGKSKTSSFYFDCDSPGNQKGLNVYFIRSAEINSISRQGFRIPLLRTKEDIFLQESFSGLPTVSKWLTSSSLLELSSGLMFNAEPSIKKSRISWLKKGDYDEQILPVLEGYNIYQYNGRYANAPEATAIDSNSEPPITNFYLPEETIKKRVQEILPSSHQKMLVMRRQARSADRFISIACVVPICGSEGSLTCFLAKNSEMHLYSACGVFNSFMFNYLAAKRQAGPNLNKAIWSCVPVPNLDEKALSRIAVLSESLHKMPQGCEEEFKTRAELETFIFNEYFTSSQILDKYIQENLIEYVMSQFPVLKNAEFKIHGEFRTKRLISEMHSNQQKCIAH